MKKIEIEQSSKAFYSGNSGLVLVGNLVNGYASLDKRLERDEPGQPRVSHADVVKTYLGLLCMGKSDFEAAAGVMDHDSFKEALDLGRVPWEETLPQRFDRYAEVFAHHVEESNTELLEKTELPVTALSAGHVALAWTFSVWSIPEPRKKGFCGRTRVRTGTHPWALIWGVRGIELREGGQHSWKGFIGFLPKMLQRARKVASEPLSVGTDAAHDA